jgi:hypothetical protein
MAQWIQGRVAPTVVTMVLLALVALAVALPIENSVTMLAGLFFFSAGVVGLSLVRDPRERANLVKIFAAAFILRILFTLLIYGLDLVRVIGGADDTGWEGAWNISRYWRGYVNAPPNIKNLPGMRPPLTFVEILDDAFGRNRGWYFFVAHYLNIIDTHSQMAVAFINAFFNSLTSCVIYRASRDYFSEKASLFAAGAAVIFPGFVAWSSLTLKEPWLIFLEILVFYLSWVAVRDRKYLLLVPAFFLMLCTYSMRYYVGYIMVAAMPFLLIGMRTRDPRGIAWKAALGMIVFYAGATGLGLVTIDVMGIVAENMEIANQFRENISGARGGEGVNSGVILPFDPSTPLGMLGLVAFGGAYLLLSPFPWALSGKQILTLPDVIIWWVLVFGFIIPGIRSAWKNHPGLAVSVLSYLFPLILMYSLLFGNIGLAYRQRAQLMPFFLIFAAAGYDARQREKRARLGQPTAKDLVARLREQVQSPVPSTPVPSASVPPSSPGATGVPSPFPTPTQMK